MAKKCCCNKGCSCGPEIAVLQTQIDDICQGLRTIYRYKPSDVSGLNYRWWSTAAGPHLDPLEWTGPADFNGFPLPTAAAPDFTGTNNNTNINDSNSGASAARYGIIHGWIFVPDGAIQLRDNNNNNGELGMVLLGECCGGSLIEQAGGKHAVSSGNAAGNNTLMDAVPINGGKWYNIYHPQSDLSAFAGLDLEYSVNGTTWSEITIQQPEAPEVECMEISACDDIPEGWSLKQPKECCTPTYAQSGGLDEGSVIALLPIACDEDPISDNNESEGSWNRAAIDGVAAEYSRCDHKHPIVRIPNPGDPVLVFGGTGTLDASLILDRLSTEEAYEYKFRTLVSQASGTGWGYITIPSIAGFQRPKITGVGTYLIGSVQVQNDDNAFGASPRPPYMGKDAHEWSSTQRVYLGFFRRDNALRMYVEFWVKYIRT